MPKVEIPGPFYFYFVSADCAERMHVHVKFQGRICKFWLNPIELHSGGRFKDHQLNQIRQLVKKNEKAIKEAWNEHCKKSKSKK